MAMLVGLGTLELFVGSVIALQRLGCLWPQSIVCCESRAASIDIIEQIIERYPVDLIRKFCQIIDPKHSGSRSYFQAAQ